MTKQINPICIIQVSTLPTMMMIINDEVNGGNLTALQLMHLDSMKRKKHTSSTNTN